MNNKILSFISATYLMYITKYKKSSDESLKIKTKPRKFFSMVKINLKIQKMEHKYIALMWNYNGHRSFTLSNNNESLDEFKTRIRKIYSNLFETIDYVEAKEWFE